MFHHTGLVDFLALRVPFPGCLVLRGGCSAAGGAVTQKDEERLLDALVAWIKHFQKEGGGNELHVCLDWLTETHCLPLLRATRGRAIETLSISTTSKARDPSERPDDTWMEVVAAELVSLTAH